MSCLENVSPISGEESRVDDLGERVIVDEATGEDGRVRRDWTSWRRSLKAKRREDEARGAWW